MASAAVFSGPRAIFKISGNLVGYAGGVNGAESIDFEPIDVLHQLEVKEFVPVAYRCTLSAQVFRVIGQSLKSRGIFPTYDEILDKPDLTAELSDSSTGKIVASFEGVRCQEHTFDVTARGIVSENVNFVAIRVKDEWDSEKYTV